MKKIVCFLLIAIGLFSSCVPNPEENPDPVIPATSILLKKMVSTLANGDSFTEEYTYAGKKILETVDSEGVRTVFTYEGDLIIREEDYQILGTDTEETLTRKADYVYDVSNNLVSYVNVEPAANTGERWIYVHNANHTISYQLFVGDATTQTTASIDGTYSTTQYVENSINDITMDPEVHTSDYTFDNKKNPYMNIIGFDKIYFARFNEDALNLTHNVLTQTDKLNDVLSGTLSASYTYAANGFPLTQTVSDENDQIVETAILSYY